MNFRSCLPEWFDGMVTIKAAVKGMPPKKGKNITEKKIHVIKSQEKPIISRSSPKRKSAEVPEELVISASKPPKCVVEDNESELESLFQLNLDAASGEL